MLIGQAVGVHLGAWWLKSGHRIAHAIGPSRIVLTLSVGRVDVLAGAYSGGLIEHRSVKRWGRPARCLIVPLGLGLWFGLGGALRDILATPTACCHTLPVKLSLCR